MEVNPINERVILKFLYKANKLIQVHKRYIIEDNSRKKGISPSKEKLMPGTDQEQPVNIADSIGIMRSCDYPPSFWNGPLLTKNNTCEELSICNGHPSRPSTYR